MLVKVNTLALEMAIKNIAERYKVPALSDAIFAEYKRIDEVHNNRISLLLSQGFDPEQDQDTFKAALLLDAELPFLGVPYEGDRGDEDDGMPYGEEPDARP